MHLCSQSELRRCRPLLGTFVDLHLFGPDPELLETAVHAAFGRVATIQRQMSVHDDDSDVGRMNRRAFEEEVEVSEDTRAVLERALQVAGESDGAFDVCVGAKLAEWGLRPKSLRRNECGNWRDVLLGPGGVVRFARPVVVDLGGVAKGYAVDAAVGALQELGVKSGVVNAGGDLRVFGERACEVQIRDPRRLGAFVRSRSLHNSALATSSPCFTKRRRKGRWVSHLVNSTSGEPVTQEISVTVEAPLCWIADALTKVVLNAPRAAEPLLKRWQATAYVFGNEAAFTEI